jgi:hypothetical protein
VLAGRGRRIRQLAGGTGKPGRRGGLGQAAGGDVGSPRGQVRVGGRFVQRQHGFHARFAAGERRRPLVPGPVLEPGRQPRAQLRPVPRVLAGGHVGQAKPGQQRGVEPRLQGTDGHPLGVRRLIDVVPGHAAVEQVHPALVPPAAGRHQHPRHGEQRRHPVDDRRVDDLPPPGGGPLYQRRADAVGHQHAAAAEVAEQVRGELRRAARPAQGVQGPGPGQVADVVPHRRGQRPVLPPPRHPGVDQPRVAGQADLGTNPDAFGHARPETLEQHIRDLGQPEQRVDRARVLQVEHGRPAAAVDQLTLRPRRGGPGPVDAQHRRALICEHHGAERPRSDARELEHPHPGQRPAASSFPSWSRRAHIPCLPVVGRLTPARYLMPAPARRSGQGQRSRWSWPARIPASRRSMSSRDSGRRHSPIVPRTTKPPRADSTEVSSTSPGRSGTAR